MTNQHLTDQELAQLLKVKAAEFKLSESEKQTIKYNLTERIALSDVTKFTEQGYRWWRYQLSFKGVTMPFLPILFAILLAGGMGTAALADNAKPGDALYPVDQLIERIQTKLATTDTTKAKLYAELADERVTELAKLDLTDPATLTSKAKTLWEEHRQEAIDRVNASIKQVITVQDKFKEKLAAATDTKQKAVFQKIVDHLSDVQQKRTDRLTKMEDKTFPGLSNNPTASSKIDEDNNTEDTDKNSGSEHQNSADPQASGGVTSQALEIKIPTDENGDLNLDLLDSDHDGIPDKNDKNPDWPIHTM